MKARDLVKEKLDISVIYKDIEEANKRGHFKMFIPHFVNFTEEVKIELINNGFKVYMGSWDGHMIDCFIIEW